MQDAKPSKDAEQSQANAGDNTQESSAVSFAFEQLAPRPTAVFSNWLSRSYLTMIGLALTLAVLYWVLFMLPNSVPPIPQVEAVSPQVAPAKLIEQAPWEDAQRAKKRREAQDVLATLLSKQEQLQNKRVEIWQKQAYAQAVEQAQNGDQLYRQQQFESAIAAYQDADSQLDAILESTPHHFNQYLQQGLAALESDNGELAKEQLTIALYLDPSNEQASGAFDRAIVLDEVMSLIKTGNAYVDEMQLELALERFNEALKLDPHSVMAKTQVETTQQAIKQQRYAKAMSQGYKQLNNKQYTSAIKYFKQAQKILPSQTAPAQAIAQSNNLTTHSQIEKIIEKALAFEQQEKWLSAKQQYQAALKVDPSLLEAKLGGLRTTARLNLANQLDKIISNPLALTDERIYQQATSVYRNALKTKPPKKHLLEQLDRVKTTLTQARIPVSLLIESDNNTKVTLYKVGLLGQFDTKKLHLNPGSYTIIGSRDGYQDVRHQFTLNANTPTTTIVVRCNQRVTNG